MEVDLERAAGLQHPLHLHLRHLQVNQRRLNFTKKRCIYKVLVILVNVQMQQCLFS